MRDEVRALVEAARVVVGPEDDWKPGTMVHGLQVALAAVEAALPHGEWVEIPQGERCEGCGFWLADIPDCANQAIDRPNRFPSETGVRPSVCRAEYGVEAKS